MRVSTPLANPRRTKLTTWPTRQHAEKDGRDPKETGKKPEPAKS